MCELCEFWGREEKQTFIYKWTHNPFGNTGCREVSLCLECSREWKEVYSEGCRHCEEEHFEAFGYPIGYSSEEEYLKEKTEAEKEYSSYLKGGNL